MRGTPWILILEFFVFSFLFFLSFSSLALVALVGLGEKDLGTPCALAIAFGASV